MSLSIVDEFNLIQFNSIQFNSIHSLTQLSYYNNSIDRIVSQYELIVFRSLPGFLAVVPQILNQFDRCYNAIRYANI